MYYSLRLINTAVLTFITHLQQGRGCIYILTHRPAQAYIFLSPGNIFSRGVDYR